MGTAQWFEVLPRSYGTGPGQSFAPLGFRDLLAVQFQAPAADAAPLGHQFGHPPDPRNGTQTTGQPHSCNEI